MHAATYLMPVISEQDGGSVEDTQRVLGICFDGHVQRVQGQICFLLRMLSLERQSVINTQQQIV